MPVDCRGREQTTNFHKKGDRPSFKCIVSLEMKINTSRSGRFALSSIAVVGKCLPTSARNSLAWPFAAHACKRACILWPPSES